MKMRCFGCNTEKDTDVLEVSPFAEEDYLINESVPPLFIIDCDGPSIPPHEYSETRMVVVCHTCFHALDPDMWISKACWDSINPTIPYDRLPMYDSSVHDPTQLKPLP